MNVVRTAPATTRITSSAIRKRRDVGPGTGVTLRAARCPSTPTGACARGSGGSPPPRAAACASGSVESSAAAGEEERTGERAAAGAGDADLGVTRHLTLATVA